MLIEPKSFTSTANAGVAVRIRFNSVVLPAPRKPVRTVRGTACVVD